MLLEDYLKHLHPDSDDYDDTTEVKLILALSSLSILLYKYILYFLVAVARNPFVLL